MIEDSPEAFVQRWRKFATTGRLFAHTEGSPLLECQVGNVIIQTLERTGPYLSRPGPARLILNAMVERLELSAEATKELEVTGLGRLRGRGEVSVLDDDMVVLDCGVPLIIGVLARDADMPALGTYASFVALPPVHLFLLQDDAQAARRRALEGSDESM